MRKLLTFLIATAAIAFGLLAPALALWPAYAGLPFLLRNDPAPAPASSSGGGRTCTDDTASGNFLARTSGLTNATQDAVCNFIKGMEADSLITGTLSGASSCGSLFDAIHLEATDNSATSLLNICGTSFSLVNHGTTFTADSGYVGAASSYIDTQYNVSTGTAFTQNNGSVWIWTITNFSTGTDYGSALATADGLINTRIYPHFSDNNFYGAVFQGSLAADATVGHFYGVTRSSSSAQLSWVDTTSVNTSVGSSTTPASTNMILLADSSTGTAHCTCNVAFSAIGANLNSTQQGNLHSRVHTYLQTVAGVP